MTFLVILKRFEVWLLLGIVAALLVFALRGEPDMGGKAPTKTTLTDTPNPDEPTLSSGDVPPPGESGPLTVSAVKMEESPGGWIIETTLSGRSPTGSDLALDESSITAATGTGEPVNRFFEPFRETSLLSVEEDSLATLRWWLPRPAESLVLVVEGTSLNVDLP